MDCSFYSLQAHMSSELVRHWKETEFFWRHKLNFQLGLFFFFFCILLFVLFFKLEFFFINPYNIKY